MAIKRPSVFGDISGKLENTVTRLRYGKYVVYAKPQKFNVSNSEKAVDERNKFGYTVKLARLVNSIPELRFAWKAAKVTGVNPYQKIIKHNAKLVSTDGLTAKNIIMPAGYDCFGNSVVIDKSEIQVSSILDKNFLHPTYKLHLFLVCFSKKENTMQYVSTDDVVLKGECNLLGRIFLSEEVMEKILIYERLLALCAFTSNAKKIFWSSTFSAELFLE